MSGEAALKGFDCQTADWTNSMIHDKIDGGCESEYSDCDLQNIVGSQSNFG